MLTAKTMTNNNENHNAQRIVIIPFRFRVGPQASRRATPCRPLPWHPVTGTSLGTGIRFHDTGSEMRDDQRTADSVVSVTSGIVWSSPVSASTRAAKLCGASWS